MIKKEGNDVVRMLIELALRAAAGCLLIASCSAATDSACPELDGKKLQHLLVYLEGDRSTLKSSCVIYAIKHLGDQRYVPAVNTLTGYLDFGIPGTERKDHEILVMRIPWLGDQYPAATALAKIGLPASSTLVEVIADASSSDLVRDNALEVLFGIYRENLPQAVSVLNRASRSASDQASSIRLWDAARKEAGKCPSETRARCEEALQQADR